MFAKTFSKIQKDILLYALIYAIWTFFIWLFTGGTDNPLWFSQWARWDSLWYEKIFTSGYSFKNLLVFPPFFSIFVGGLSKIFFLSFHATAAAVNFAAYFAGLVVLTEILSKQFKILSKFWLFVFALSAPASYFVFTSYTDCFFFFLFWTVIGLELSNWYKTSLQAKYLYALLFFILPGVRLTGYAFFSWIFFKRWVAALVLVTLVGWLWLNYKYTGNAFFFLQAQQLFGMPKGGLFTGLASAWHNLFYMPKPVFSGNWNDWMATALLPFLFFAFVALSVIWLAVKKQWMLCFIAASVFLISFNQAYWRSAVRYALPLQGFLGVMLYKFSEGKIKYYIRPLFFVFLVFCFITQIYFASIFHKGGWGF